MSQPARTQEPPDPLRPAWTPVTGDLVADKYRVGGLIGKGGMGAVFHAVDVRDNRAVAVKWVLPDRDRGRSRERLLREAALTRRVEHPNVVRVYDVGEERGSIFLVMELLQGDSLEAWVLRSPCVAPMAVQLMLPILRGVQAAHDAGVIHRDLKPHNIILCRETAGFRPTVIDFGISRGEGVEGDLTLTQTGMMVGTPLYMAPEQLAGKDETDERLDVYALGVMLYELLSGGTPFEEEKYGPLLTEKLTRPAIRLSAYLPEVDPELERVVMKALERNPDKRYTSVAELGRAIEPFSAGPRFDDDDSLYRGPAPGGGDSATLKVRRTARRKRRAARWPIAVAAAILIVGVGVALGAWLSGGDRDLAVTELPNDDERTIEAPDPPTEPMPQVDPVPMIEPPVAVADPEPPDEESAAEEPDEEGDPAAEAESGARERRRGRRRRRARGVGRSGRLSAGDFF